MAEEKKKILIHTADGDHVVSVGEHKPKQTFGAMPVKDYVAAVADPDGLPQAGSVGAVVSALAAAMGSLAVRALRSDDAQMQKTAEELRQMTDYMVFQIDEELRARASRLTGAESRRTSRAPISTARCALRATFRTRSCTSCAAASSS